MSGRENAKDPDCMKCRSFYITWDRVRPYGCRAFGFKGRQMPCVTVRESSGMSCSKFIPGMRRRHASKQS